MAWIGFIIIVILIIVAFTRGGGSSGNDENDGSGGGGGGRKIPLPVKIGAAGAAGYVIGKKLGKI